MDLFRVFFCGADVRIDCACHLESGAPERLGR